MNAVKILRPTDFSSSSAAALEMAASLARDRGATLVVAHVEEAPLAYGDVDFGFRPECRREELLQMLKRVVPTDNRISYEHRLIAGLPSVAIIKLAQRERVDLIVMATHGRTGLTRALMRSVAEEVVRKATCPVLVVKSPVAPATASRSTAACAALA